MPDNPDTLHYNGEKVRIVARPRAPNEDGRVCCELPSGRLVLVRPVALRRPTDTRLVIVPEYDSDAPGIVIEHRPRTGKGRSVVIPPEHFEELREVLSGLTSTKGAKQRK